MDRKDKRKRRAERGDWRARVEDAVERLEAGEIEDVRAEIVDAAARAFWVEDWALDREDSREHPSMFPGGRPTMSIWRPTHRITFRPKGREAAHVEYVAVWTQDPDDDGLVPAPTHEEWLQNDADQETACGALLEEGWFREDLSDKTEFRWQVENETPGGREGELEVQLAFDFLDARGQDLDAIAPTTPREADAAAEEFVARVEALNGAPASALYALALEAPGQHLREPDAAHFGHCLAMQALGHGVSWFDDHPKFPLRLPRVSFSDLHFSMGDD